MTLASVVIFTIIVVGLSCFIAWIWKHTKGSVLLTILTHLSVNLNVAGSFFPGVARAQQQLSYSSLAVFWLFVLGLILVERQSWTATPALTNVEAV